VIVGYHMSSLPLHDEASAISALREMGYGAIALVPRRTSLRLDSQRGRDLVAELGEQSRAEGIEPVLALESPFVADPGMPRWPSLASEDKEEAEASDILTRQWIEAAASLRAKLVTFSSGSPHSLTASPDDMTPDKGAASLDRLSRRINGLRILARDLGVTLALRPSAGHAVATIAHYERLLQWIDDPRGLTLAAEVDAMVQAGEMPVADRLMRHLDALECLYIDNRQLGSGADKNNPLAFDGTRLLRTLKQSGYRGRVILRRRGEPSKTTVRQSGLIAWPSLADAGVAIDAFRVAVGETGLGSPA